MKTNKLKKYLKFITDDWNSLKQNPSIMMIILLLLPFIYLLVYYTGGIKFGYSHSMYIPILLAGIFYGMSFGVIIAIIASLLMGPLIPINTVTGESQEMINWLYRMIYFVLIGTIIGFASSKLRKDKQKIEALMSVNQETKVPNFNYLHSICPILRGSKYSVATVLINNYHNILDVLGSDIYHSLVHQIYIDLMIKLNPGSFVIQADSNKLWVIMPHYNLEIDIQMLGKLLNQPIQVNSIPLYVDYSIGGSIVQDLDNCKNSTIFQDSDISARLAQINNTVYVLGDENVYKKRSDYDLLAVFTKAIENNETYLVYQPKIDIATMKPFGLEALMRWNHPTRGNIAPDIFIPLIEQTKLIHLLTDWVLINTLTKTKEMIDLGIELPISINISGKNLYDPQFFERSIRLIEESKVPFDLIEFELTESTLMVNPEESRIILQKFVDRGIKISLDDFGSGYSSLAQLTKFPIDYIKIDRFFMKNITIDSQMLTIVKSTIELSKKLGYHVIVEGVETKEVLDLMASVGCDYAQGFYFAKPMLGEDINDWIAKNR